MANPTINTAAANAYAKAMLELANAENAAWEVAGELAGIVEVLDADSAFEQFLGNPAVSGDSRGPVLAKAFEGRVRPVVWNFIRLLNVKGRLSMLRPIAAAYDDLVDQQFGKVEVDVTVAQRLSDDELEQVRQAVGQALKRDAVVHQYVDESIIGGLVLRVQDKLIDTSVRAQLANIRRQMLAARPKAAAVTI